MELMGVIEIAELLSISRQRVVLLSKADGFPAPVADLQAGPVWKSEDIEEWARSTGRLPAGSETVTRSVQCVGGPLEGVVFDTDAPVGATVTPPGADDVVYLISDDKLASGRWGAVFRGSA